MAKIYFSILLATLTLAYGTLASAADLDDLHISPRAEAEVLADLKASPQGKERQLILIKAEPSDGWKVKTDPALQRAIQLALQKKYRAEFGASQESPLSFALFQPDENETQESLEPGAVEGPDLMYLIAMRSGYADDEFAGPFYALDVNGNQVSEFAQYAFSIELHAKFGPGPKGMEVHFDHATVHGWMNQQQAQKWVGAPLGLTIPNY